MYETVSRSWEDFGRRIARLFYPLQPRARTDCRLAIENLTSHRSGDFRFTSSAMKHDAPIGGIREWRHIESDTPDEFVLIVADTAPLRYTQFRRQADLPVRSMMLLDARTPYEYERCSSGHVICYHVPGRVLRQTLPFPEDYCAIRIGAHEGIGAALHSFISLAWEQTVGDPARREMLFRDIAALIPVATQTCSTQSRAVRRCDPLERAEAFINANLSRSSLSVGEIAAAVGISTSRLQTLAREKGSSIGRMVLASRLEASAAALLAGGKSAPKLIDVALDHGFVSPSHFSRAFRQHFGCSPREYAARSRP